MREDPFRYYSQPVELYKSESNMKVHLVTEKATYELYVLKQIKNAIFGEQDLDRLKSECFLLQSIESEHVMKPRCIYEFRNQTSVIFKYMDGSSFDKIIKRCHNLQKTKQR